jgi:Spy/CpxP family protein refolding chaperone
MSQRLALLLCGLLCSLSVAPSPLQADQRDERPAAKDLVFIGGPGLHLHGGGPGGPLMGDGPGMFLPLILKKLNLTPDQETQVHTIIEAHHANFRSLFQRLEAVHNQLTTKFFTGGPLTAADLADLTKQVKDLREQLMNEGLAVAFEVRTLLTPEQLAQGAQAWEQMQAMRAQMRSFFEEKP